MVLAELTPAQDHHANRGNKEQDADDLKGKIKAAEEGHPDIRNIGVATTGQGWERFS